MKKMSNCAVTAGHTNVTMPAGFRRALKQLSPRRVPGPPAQSEQVHRAIESVQGEEGVRGADSDARPRTQRSR